MTSVLHVAPSIAFFKAKSMKPVPAPIGYPVKDTLTISPARLFPSAKWIDKIERVVYEYQLITWAMLRGQKNLQNLTRP